MKPWYTIQNREGADDKPAVLSIHDEIGYWGVTSKQFGEDLKSIKASTVTVEINSPGGDVFAGLTIFNMLRASGKTVNTNVLGIAASIASVILQANSNGGKRTMPENAMVMTHKAWSVAIGNADEMRDTADVLDKIDNSLISIYVKATGKSEEDVRAMLAKDVYMSAAEALEAGLVDEITDAAEISASFDLDSLPENVRAVYASALKPNASDDPTPSPAPAPEPSPAPAPEPAPAPSPSDEQAPTVDEIGDAVKAAGLSKFSATFALDTTLTSKAKLTEAIAYAKEVNALCDLTETGDLATGFIAKRRPLTEVRAEIAKARADRDEAANTSNVRRSPPKTAQNAQPTGDDIWQAHRKQQSIKE